MSFLLNKLTKERFKNKKEKENSFED